MLFRSQPSTTVPRPELQRYHRLRSNCQLVRKRPQPHRVTRPFAQPAHACLHYRLNHCTHLITNIRERERERERRVRRERDYSPKGYQRRIVTFLFSFPVLVLVAHRVRGQRCVLVPSTPNFVSADHHPAAAPNPKNRANRSSTFPQFKACQRHPSQ